MGQKLLSLGHRSCFCPPPLSVPGDQDLQEQCWFPGEHGLQDVTRMLRADSLSLMLAQL